MILRRTRQFLETALITQHACRDNLGDRTITDADHFNVRDGRRQVAQRIDPPKKAFAGTKLLTGSNICGGLFASDLFATLPTAHRRERLRREPTTREICFAYLEMAKKILRPGEATDRDGGPHYAFDMGFDYPHCVHTHAYSEHMHFGTYS